MTPRAYGRRHAGRRCTRRCRARSLSQHRAFTRSQAAELNFDRGRIATAKRLGWLAEPYAGVLILAGAAPTWHQRLMVATLAARGHGVASHRAAARLHGLDGFERCDVIEVSIERGRRSVRTDGVVVHQVAALDACDIVRVDGIPCTGVARTLADLGSVMADPASVRRALTHLRRRGTSLRWLQLTAERLHRPGQRGTGVLLRQLASISAGTRRSARRRCAIVKQVVAARQDAN